MSQKPMSNTKVAFDVNQLKKQYPYIGKCVKTMYQADISNVHGLSQYFDYDGIPGKYA